MAIDARSFPFYSALSEEERKLLDASLREHGFVQGAQVHGGECTGLLLVKEGRLRAYTMSEEGREITLYRLGQGDVCLLSASCVLKGLQVDLFISAETDARIFLLPAEVYRRLAERSAAVSSFANELMARRFSEVMWVLSEVLNKKFDARLAALRCASRTNSSRGTWARCARRFRACSNILNRRGMFPFSAAACVSATLPPCARLQTIECTAAGLVEKSAVFL